MPLCSVARYSFTGIVTSPNWIAPRHIDRAMCLPCSRDDAFVRPARDGAGAEGRVHRASKYPSR